MNGSFLVLEIPRKIEGEEENEIEEDCPPALQLARGALDVIPRIHQSPFMYRMIGADGREYGPISAEQLRQWIGQGRANAATSVLPEGASEWKPLGSLPEFSMLFAAPASTPAPGPMPGAAPAAPAVFPTSTVQPLRTNGFATAGLVLGIVSITLGLCCCYGIPFNIAGLIFSIIAISQINSHPERYDGKTMALIAIVLCCLSLLIGILMFSLGIAGAFWEPHSHHGYRL